VEDEGQPLDVPTEMTSEHRPPSADPRARAADAPNPSRASAAHEWSAPSLESLEHELAGMLRNAEHFGQAFLDLALPEPGRRHGLSPRAERAFTAFGAALLMGLGAMWSWVIASGAPLDPVDAAASVTPGLGARVASALADPNTPTAAYLSDLAFQSLTPMRGESGKLQVRLAPLGGDIAGGLPAGADLRFEGGDASASGAAASRIVTHADSAGDSLQAPARPGIWRLAVAIGDAVRPVEDFHVITLTPFAAKRAGRIGLYYIGSWPTERRASPNPKYRPPSGFIEVTPETQDTRLSEHFRLRDFLPHDQPNVWPKYVVVDTKLVDKLELVLSDLEKRGYAVNGARVMSGFRTPQYNTGGGDPRGRATLSRHMYGDAADIYLDTRGTGNMGDLNRDGRVNIRDAEVIRTSVDRVEHAYPALVGGSGIYPATSAHGPFIHIDTRGYRARWTATGDD
jgi:uncharacterized protein YcbK (DUF882 family)